MFEQTIINQYGKRGEIWLKNLPVLIATISTEYELSHLLPIEQLSYHYVLKGLQNQKPVIVKLGLDIAEFKQEANALQALSGHGVVQLLAQKDGLLLLECAEPGISLNTYFPHQDESAMRITAELMIKLQSASPSSYTFPRLCDWLVVLDKQHADIPERYLKKARKLRDQLLSSSTTSILLHGDLHHGNILKNGDSWIAIDPKGVMGDPVYEVVAFIRNPIPDLLSSTVEPLSFLKKRVSIFSSLLNIAEKRIWDWCFVQSVLSWVWALEDGSDPDYFYQISKMFDEIN